MTAYVMRISDWSSDFCSSDLGADASRQAVHPSRRAMSAYRPMPQDIPPLWLHPKRREGDARADSIDSSVAQPGDDGLLAASGADRDAAGLSVGTGDRKSTRLNSSH